MPSTISIGILTVSDTCFRKEREDVSGRKLREALKTSSLNCKIKCMEIVPDDRVLIQDTLTEWSTHCDVILTTGGTGFSSRDVTPEATKAVIDREAPGLAYAMISKSLEITPMAMLSRAVCGIKNNALIINLPGSAKGSVECLSFVMPAIPHATSLMRGDSENISKDHLNIQKETPCTSGMSKVSNLTGNVCEIPGNYCQPSRIQVDNVAGRARISTYPLVEVEEANAIILRECSPTIEIEEVSIEHALYRVLAEDIVAVDPVPPFNASIKDGYAVVASDDGGPRRIKNFSAAGDDPRKAVVKSGEAIRICTGAPIPEGADAVVQVEDTTLLKTSTDGKEEILINIDKSPTQGQDIRLVGSDVPANATVLCRCQRLKAADIGILATVAKPHVKVFKRATVGIISTGNELVDYREQPRAGQIRDSNRLTLINLLKQHHQESKDFGIVEDNPDKLKSMIVKALVQNDVVITTGGVSMGEYDLIKQILVEDFQAYIHFGRVNMKPGKPTTFATLMFNGRRKIVFGLPGNPVSAGVTCLLFVIPMLKYIERSKSYNFPKIMAFVPQEVTNMDSRPEYIRVELKLQSGDVEAHPNGNQISSRLNSLVGSNGLLLVPPKTARFGKTNRPVLIIDSL